VAVAHATGTNSTMHSLCRRVSSKARCFNLALCWCWSGGDRGSRSRGGWLAHVPAAGIGANNLLPLVMRRDATEDQKTYVFGGLAAGQAVGASRRKLCRPLVLVLAHEITGPLGGMDGPCRSLFAMYLGTWVPAERPAGVHVGWTGSEGSPAKA
jgi:hypothetical protein